MGQILEIRHISCYFLYLSVGRGSNNEKKRKWKARRHFNPLCQSEDDTSLSLSLNLEQYPLPVPAESQLATANTQLLSLHEKQAQSSVWSRGEVSPSKLWTATISSWSEAHLQMSYIFALRRSREREWEREQKQKRGIQSQPHFCK